MIGTDVSSIGNPITDHFEFYDPPPEQGGALEFRLVYQGKLPAEGKGSSHSFDKHVIRKAFHPQLKELWKNHRSLRYIKDIIINHGAYEGKSYFDFLGDTYRRCDHRFLPLIRKANEGTCSLDILFLRRDAPGHIIRSGGDIDNRIKVLFDALRVPDVCNGLPSTPDPDENPFYCLLEDDSLITEVKVTTDVLLKPCIGSEKIHDVMLVLTVRTNLADAKRPPIGPTEIFGGLEVALSYLSEQEKEDPEEDLSDDMATN